MSANLGIFIYFVCLVAFLWGGYELSPKPQHAPSPPEDGPDHWDAGFGCGG
jgi:hypothetical protein